MKRKIRTGFGPLASPLLKLAVPLACLLPLHAGARVEISADDGSGTPTGDPLDSNDYGSGGGQGERYQHDPTWPGVTGVTLPGVKVGDHRVLLVPFSQGGLLTFRLVIVQAPAAAPESTDAR